MSRRNRNPKKEELQEEKQQQEAVVDNKPVVVEKQKKNRASRAQIDAKQAEAFMKQLFNIKEMRGNMPSYEYKQVKGCVQRNKADKVPPDDVAKVRQLVDTIHATYNNRPISTLAAMAGYKLASKLDTTFQTSSVQHQRQILDYILADDLPTALTTAVRTVAPHLLSSIWGKVRQYGPMQKILTALKDTLGIDLNDGYCTSVYNATQGNKLDWGMMDDRYQQELNDVDSVNPQAVATILMPEYDACRIPSDNFTKSGLYSRTNSYTISTNDAGNAIFVFYPTLANTGTSYPGYLNIYNNNVLNIVTGLQNLQPCTSIAGPLNGVNGFSLGRISGWSCTISSIASVLNNGGRVITVIGQSNFQSGTQQAPVNTQNCRDKDYCIYTSFQEINGHRAVWMDNQSAPGEFLVMNASGAPSNNNFDYVAFILQGCQVNTQVLQVNTSFVFEYSPSDGFISQVSAPPSGIYTMQAIASALQKRPDLRILGREEAQALYAALISVTPHYRSVLQVLTGVSFGNRHLESLFNNNSSMSRTVGFAKPSNGGVSPMTS